MRLAIAVLIVLFLCATPAQAGWKIDRATAIAERVWNNPCGGNVTLTWGPTHDDNAAETIIGRCPATIVFSNTQRWPWTEFCTTLLHEYGHVAGYDHDANNPYDIMFDTPAWDVDTGVNAIEIGGVVYPARHPFGDPRCKDRGRAFL